MKNIMETRIRRIEDLLKTGSSVCMIARKDQRGFTWNGVTYLNEKALTIAAKEIAGECWERPLIILERA